MLSTSAAADEGASKPATEKPAAPFEVAQPEAPSKTFRGNDLTMLDAEELSAAAQEAYRNKEFETAARFQYWYVVATGEGQYNLACEYALMGRSDGAFYWLREAALEEGLDADWPESDTDLESIRKDGRWARFVPFLKACEEYWVGSGYRVTSVVVPEGYQPDKPIGVVVGLHGKGADPAGFISPGFQHWADRLGLAFVGVSGSIPKGAHKFHWSTDPKRDADQIRGTLKSLSGRLTVKPGDVVLLGFSQGAQMAFEVALLNPTEFRGAIVMSPGGVDEPRLKGFTASPKNRLQRFVCLAGAKEFYVTVDQTKEDASLAKRAGAAVELKLYEDVSDHTYPPDFGEKLEVWITDIRGGHSSK